MAAPQQTFTGQVQATPPPGQMSFEQVIQQDPQRYQQLNEQQKTTLGFQFFQKHVMLGQGLVEKPPEVQQDVFRAFAQHYGLQTGDIQPAQAPGQGNFFSDLAAEATNKASLDVADRASGGGWGSLLGSFAGGAVPVLTGAGTGALAGSLFGPVGTAVGGIAGGIAGAGASGLGSAIDQQTDRGVPLRNVNWAPVATRGAGEAALQAIPGGSGLKELLKMGFKQAGGEAILSPATQYMDTGQVDWRQTAQDVATRFGGTFAGPLVGKVAKNFKVPNAVTQAFAGRQKPKPPAELPAQKGYNYQEARTRAQALPASQFRRPSAEKALFDMLEQRIEDAKNINATAALRKMRGDLQNMALNRSMPQSHRGRAAMLAARTEAHLSAGKKAPAKKQVAATTQEMDNLVSLVRQMRQQGRVKEADTILGKFEPETRARAYDAVKRHETTAANRRKFQATAQKVEQKKADKIQAQREKTAKDNETENLKQIREGRVATEKAMAERRKVELKRMQAETKRRAKQVSQVRKENQDAGASNRGGGPSRPSNRQGAAKVPGAQKESGKTPSGKGLSGPAATARASVKGDKGQRESLRRVVHAITERGTDTGDQPAVDFLEKAGFSLRAIKNPKDGTIQKGLLFDGHGMVRIRDRESIGGFVGRLRAAAEGSSGKSDPATVIANKLHREGTENRIDDDVADIVRKGEAPEDVAEFKTAKTQDEIAKRESAYNEYLGRVEKQAETVLSDIDSAKTRGELNAVLEKAYSDDFQDAPDSYWENLGPKVRAAEARMAGTPAVEHLGGQRGPDSQPVVPAEYVQTGVTKQRLRNEKTVGAKGQTVFNPYYTQKELMGANSVGKNGQLYKGKESFDRLTDAQKTVVGEVQKALDAHKKLFVKGYESTTAEKRTSIDGELYTPIGFSLTRDGSIIVRGYNEDGVLSSRKIENFKGSVRMESRLKAYQGLFHNAAREPGAFDPADALVEKVMNPIWKNRVLGRVNDKMDYKNAAKRFQEAALELNDPKDDAVLESALRKLGKEDKSLIEHLCANGYHYTD